jgi:hypothetical protein
VDLVTESAANPLSSMYLSASEPRRCFLTIVRDKAGREVRRLEQMDFLSSGFPGRWKRTEFREDGTREVEEREVLQAEFDREPEAALFSFSVPREYIGAEVGASTVKFTSPDGKVEERPRSAEELPVKGGSPPSGRRFAQTNAWIVILLSIVGLAFSLRLTLRKKRV